MKTTLERIADGSEDESIRDIVAALMEYSEETMRIVDHRVAKLEELCALGGLDTAKLVQELADSRDETEWQRLREKARTLVGNENYEVI